MKLSATASLAVLAVVIVFVGKALVSHADSVVLKNGAVIHGAVTTEGQKINISFGEKGKLTIPKYQVAKIIKNDLDEFAMPSTRLQPPTQVQKKPIAVTVKKGTDATGAGGRYVGRHVASEDDRFVSLQTEAGATVKILASNIEKTFL